MARNKLVNGELVALTAEEEAVLDAKEAVYEADKPRRAALAAIAALEAQVTQRRLREAALTDEGKAWLQNIEDQIAAERAKAR